jgi:hypothetical protein
VRAALAWAAMLLAVAGVAVYAVRLDRQLKAPATAPLRCSDGPTGAPVLCQAGGVGISYEGR